MKSIETKMTIALLVLAGGMFPVFGQDRGHERGGDRGFQQREREHAQTWQAPRNGFPGQATQQFQRHENFPQGRSFQPQPQRNAQDIRRQNYGPDVRESRGGSSFTEDRSRVWENDRRQNNRWENDRWENDRRSWSGRGGYRGYVIPQTRFYSSFGRDHFFRIGRPQFYGGYPRFQYGGYWFRVVDPFPAFWASNWYDTDDVYIDYNDDGYYLYDRRYPDEGIPVEIEN